jgi:ABC-type branched-subunit amino acid transport system substrate-binding protein
LPLVSTSRPAALLIREARKVAPGMVIMALSTVAPDQLRDELKPEEVRGVGIAQTIPNPNAIRLPIVQEYQALFRRSGITSLDYFSIEGFINAKVLVAALRRSGAAPTPAKFRAGIESLREFDLGGMRVSFGPRDRTGSTFVDVTVIGHDGKVLK